VIGINLDADRSAGAEITDRRNHDPSVARTKIVNYIVLSDIRNPEHILDGIIAGRYVRNRRTWGRRGGFGATDVR